MVRYVVKDRGEGKERETERGAEREVCSLSNEFYIYIYCLFSTVFFSFPCLFTYFLYHNLFLPVTNDFDPVFLLFLLSIMFFLHFSSSSSSSSNSSNIFFLLPFTLFLPLLLYGIFLLLPPPLSLCLLLLFLFLRAGIMDNIKANVPRTAYHGIVTVWKEGTKLHIVPDDLT